MNPPPSPSDDRFAYSTRGVSRLRAQEAQGISRFEALLEQNATDKTVDGSPDRRARSGSRAGASDPDASTAAGPEVDGLRPEDLEELRERSRRYAAARRAAKARGGKLLFD